MITDTYKKYVFDENILIYQMGKVGSNSLATSLRKIGVNSTSIHSFFKPIPLSEFKEYKAVKYYLPKRKAIFQHCFWRMQFHLLKRRKKIKVITMAREPISRNISFYFQDFQIPLMEIMRNSTKKCENNNIEPFVQDFFEHFNHCHGVDWFDTEFKRALKIDIYDYPFEKDKGYRIIKEKKLEILVIQVEKLSALQSVIGEFIGHPEFRVINENVGNKKWYSCIHQNFMNNIKFSEEYIDSLYNTKYMNHFYTEMEINRFREKYLCN